MTKRSWHGTTGGYNNHKCRCWACKAAWATRCREARRLRRQLGLCVDCNTPSEKARCAKHRDKSYNVASYSLPIRVQPSLEAYTKNYTGVLKAALKGSK